MRPGKNEECGVEDRMAGEPDAPKPRMINPRDDDLPRGEFEKLAPCALPVSRDEALRHKQDLRACAVGRIRDRIVIADGAVPGSKNIQPFEGFPINGGRASPREVAVVVAEDAYR